MQEALDQIFLHARTHSYWQNQDVPHELLKKIYETAVMGPTSANCLPLRIVFVQSLEEKKKLEACLLPGNIEKTKTAPVTAIFAYDMHFYEHFSFLFPHADAKSWFTGNDQLIKDTAFRNSSLQAAYFMLAARAYGLDCGPMSGFDHEKLDQTFLANTSYRSNFICNLGYGLSEKLHPRLPRLSFEETCQII